MECRDKCGACCIAPSIQQPFYGMPQGKPAGIACVHLDRQMRCGLFNDLRRPAVCANFTAEREFCGDTREEAIKILLDLESTTASNNSVL